MEDSSSEDRSSPAFLHKNPVIEIVRSAGINYKAPLNLSSLWNFGVYSLVCLLIQIVSGVVLAMHYTAHIDLAFLSVEHIMRDVNYGWLIRYIHANGASMFFIVVYMHTFRGLYYSSYTQPRQILWNVGVTILFLMIATAFMGYVLPWGQMSFWGATVITNLFSAIPVLGSDIVIWLWGGYSIANATLVRFFSLHFLFPIIIAALVVLHLHLLHLSSSSNPIGQNLSPSKIFFTPYYIVKDLFGVIIFLMLFTSFVFFYPNVLGHSDNYIPANPLVTPPHIVPEWYLLPFYAVLRSIPDKLLGVIALAACIIILYFLPFISVPLIKSLKFRPIPRVVFFLFVAIALVLGWIGGCIVSYPFIQIGQIFGISYFVYFLINLPLYNYCNNTK